MNTSVRDMENTYFNIAAARFAEIGLILFHALAGNRERDVCRF